MTTTRSRSASALAALLASVLLAGPALADPPPARPRDPGPALQKPLTPNVVLDGANLTVVGASLPSAYAMRVRATAHYKNGSHKELFDKRFTVDTSRGEPKYLLKKTGVQRRSLEAVVVTVAGLNPRFEPGPRAMRQWHPGPSAGQQVRNRLASPACYVTATLLYTARDASKFTLHALSGGPIAGELKSSKFRVLRKAAVFTEAAGAGYDLVTTVETLTTGDAKDQSKYVLQAVVENSKTGQRKVVKSAFAVDDAYTFMAEAEALATVPRQVQESCRGL